MITFLNGPAKGQSLSLTRAAYFLRIVHGPKGWDGLDQLEDTPAPDETIHIYRAANTPSTVHVDGCTNGKRWSKWMVHGEYRLAIEQPDDATARNNPAWREWCQDQAKKGNR